MVNNKIITVTFFIQNQVCCESKTYFRNWEEDLELKSNL